MSDVIDILRRLVAIPSVNPDLCHDPQVTGELRLVDDLEGAFAKRGFYTERLEVVPHRPNLIAHLSMPASRKRILFASHLDTIGVDGFAGNPFNMRHVNGRLIGRGACDTKGPLAAFLAALDFEVCAHLRKAGIQLIWVGTIGEETGSIGAEQVAATSLRAEECVVLEPTNFEIICAHKGVCWFKVATSGHSSHASLPSQSDNAISKMPRVWKVLEEMTAEAAKTYAHPVLGGPTLSIGTIQGGTAPNVVPDRCEIQVDRRFVPGEDMSRYLVDVRLRLQEAVTGGVTVSQLRQGNTFSSPPEGVLPRRMSVALQQANKPAVVTGAAWCSDAAVLSSISDETIVWGPGSIAQAHTNNESIDVDALVQGRDAIRNYLLNQ